MTTIDAKSLLAIRSQILERNAVLAKASAPAAAPPSGGFGDVMNQALGAVNEQQSRASAAAASYERGDTAAIAAVMLQSQKASIAFEATLQVRHRPLAAYKQIGQTP